MSFYSEVEEAETNLSHEVRLICASVAHGAVHNNDFCFSSTRLKIIPILLFSLHRIHLLPVKMMWLLTAAANMAMLNFMHMPQPALLIPTLLHLVTCQLTMR